MAEGADVNDTNLVVRVKSTALDTFKERSKLVTGKSYTVLTREIIDAFNEGRLRIVTTDEQKQLHGELYQ